MRRGSGTGAERSRGSTGYQHPLLRSFSNDSGTPLHELGGLALFNGVMIQGRTGYAVAIRLADGGIYLRQVPGRALPGWMLIPFLRGPLLFVGMTLRAFEAFFLSIYLSEAKPPREALRHLSFPPSYNAERLFFLIYSLISFVLLFGLSSWPLQRIDGAGWLGALVLGLGLKLLLLMGYIGLLHAFSDVRRLFQYHGAEHRVLWVLQSGKRLAVDVAQGMPLRHPRCGIVFLLYFLLTHEVLLAITTVLGWGTGLGYVESVARQILVFVGAFSLAFEWFRRSTLGNPAPPKGKLRNVITVPLKVGLWLQEWTTRAPSDEQVETALVALHGALTIEPGQRSPQNWVVQGLHPEL